MVILYRTDYDIIMVTIIQHVLLGRRRGKTGKNNFPNGSVIFICNNYKNNQKGILSMKKYVCTVCGYVYDEAEGAPDEGIEPGTKWEDIPEDWTCPMCGASKSEFEEE